jgi:Mce-associated membrane protein
MTATSGSTPDDTGDTRSSGEPVSTGETSSGKRWPRRLLARWRVIVLVFFVVAGPALATGLFYGQYRPDQQADDAATQGAVTAASEGAVAVLSYSPDTLDRDLATAKSHLTGEFLTYYDQFSKQYLAPAVTQGDVSATVTVRRAAASEMHPDSAVVLLFLNQTATSKNRQEPAATASAVRVTLTKVKGSWLIAKFEPI